MSRLLAWLDRKSFLGFQVWDFSCRSFFLEYGRLFLARVLLRHPARFVRGLCAYRRVVRSRPDLAGRYDQSLAIPDDACVAAALLQAGPPPLVGVGFCLKPNDPSDAALTCPSGHANHECQFLQAGATAGACSRCLIHAIAQRCLRARCRVYVMTSARDIAADFLLPQADRGSFPSAILLLCPYSVQAILPALLICNIDSLLIAYGKGYCRDFREWLRADRGIKDEQTSLEPHLARELFAALERRAAAVSPASAFERRGNIFEPAG